MKRTLMHRLILYFILAALVPSVLVAAITYVNSSQNIRQSAIRDNTQMLSQVMERIVLKMRQMDDFSYWVDQNDTIHTLLNMTSEELEDNRWKRSLMVEELREHLVHQPMAEYLLSLYIIGENGLDLRDGTEASFVDTDTIQLTLQRFTNTDFWSGIMENITNLSAHRRVIMYQHPLYSKGTAEPVGYVLITFSEDFFKDEFRFFAEGEGKHAILMTEKNIILSLAGSDGKEVHLLPLLTSNKQTTEYIQMECYDTSNRLLIRGLVSNQIITEQQRVAVMSGMLLVGLTLGIALVISYFLSVNLIHPISVIIDNVDKISAGQFKGLNEKNDGSELGNLNCRIIKMSHDIQALMEEQEQREKEKRFLELRMLQAQINPHFLYNALNSVRMMASMQGIESIESAVGALGRLVKANQSIMEEWIPLSRELELVKSYVYLQNIQYKGKIHYHERIDPESVSLQMVPKFTLQPLVENSIVHGLSQKRQGGDIEILCKYCKGCLLIEVGDTGIGMTDEQLSVLQDRLSASTEHPENHIGIQNVAQRIRLRCGREYGLDIKNRPSGGLLVRVWLPYAMKGEAEQNGTVQSIDC